MKTTIADIAKEAGVSKATVSRVLNNRPEGVGTETRLRIQEIMVQRRFKPSGPARVLATGRTKSVGLVVPDIADPFFPLLIRGIEAALGPLGYGLFLCDANLDVSKERDQLKRLAEKGVDGVLLSSTHSRAESWDALEERAIPWVLLDRMADVPGGTCGVFSDNRGGARLAAEHLLAHGRRLVFIDGPSALMISRLRRQGVEDALAARGMDWGEVIQAAGDYSLESGFEAIHRLWTGRAPEFGAVFASNDRMAIGALKAIKARGLRVPEDVELVGFDDIEMARLVEPALTTVAQPAFEMGRQAAELLLGLMAGRSPPTRTVVLQPTLVLRDSTIREP